MKVFVISHSKSLHVSHIAAHFWWHSAAVRSTAALALDDVVDAEYHFRRLAGGFYGLRLYLQRLYHSMGFHVHCAAVDHVHADMEAALIVLVPEFDQYVYRVFSRGFSERARDYLY